MADLSVDFAGLKLKNPFIIASSELTNKVEKIKGMNICITTTAATDAEGLALLKQLGMPFRQ